MNKYEKAVAYVNDIACGMTQAEIVGMNVVYISTEVDDTQFRIHEEEVNALAQKYDLHFANL